MNKFLGLPPEAGIYYVIEKISDTAVKLLSSGNNVRCVNYLFSDRAPTLRKGAKLSVDEHGYLVALAGRPGTALRVDPEVAKASNLSWVVDLPEADYPLYEVVSQTAHRLTLRGGNELCECLVVARDAYMSGDQVIVDRRRGVIYTCGRKKR